MLKVGDKVKGGCNNLRGGIEYYTGIVSEVRNTRAVISRDDGNYWNVRKDDGGNWRSDNYGGEVLVVIKE